MISRDSSMGRCFWNLSSREFHQINIYLLTLLPDAHDTDHVADNLRMLVLSHSLAYSRIPSFFLEETPSFFPKSEGPSVVLFDIDNRFLDFPLPSYIQTQKQIWTPSEYFTNEIVYDFRLSLTLCSLYDYSMYNPLYFTTHILIPENTANLQPFIICYMPILREKKLRIRTLLQQDLKIFLNYPKCPKIGSYIMIPPYCHPFKVISVENENILIKYVDLSEKTVNWKETNFILLARPNISIGRYFIQNPTTCRTPQIEDSRSAKSQSTLGLFETEEYMDVDPSALEAFFLDMDSTKTNCQELETSYELIYPTPSAIDIAEEQISDFEELKTITDSFKRNGEFPSHNLETTLLVATFLSYFRFDFGFNSAMPIPGAVNFAEYSDIEYERLGIPDIKVNCDGAPMLVNAREIIDVWEERRLQPISGAKFAHFVVFYESRFEESMVRTFFKSFANQYTNLCFGSLVPYPKTDAFIRFTGENAAVEIMGFFQSYPVAQFQEEPLMTFVVGDVIFQEDFFPPSVISYVRPDAIIHAEIREIQNLAFVVYSRLRVFASQPNGKVYLAQFNMAPCLFGFRYQPPFVLQAGESMSFHICWDKYAKLCALVDGAGTVMHVFPSSDLKMLLGYFSELICGDHFQTESATISFLGEGVSKNDLEELFTALENLPAALNATVRVFSVNPCSAFQAVIDEPFDDDAVAFESPEQLREQEAGDYARPDATCFVFSRRLQPYTCSYYARAGDEPPRAVLAGFVRQMSHLSWLSVKPTMEFRTISYPPQVAALLRKGNRPTSIISPFEFLPSMEEI